MTDEHAREPRWVVLVEEGPPHGGLYELEIDTTFKVVDRCTGEVVLVFHGDYSASFGTDGDWGPGTTGGVVKVEVADSEREAVVHWADGRVERVPLPSDPVRETRPCHP